jgi:hypothetical protein
MPGNCQIVTKTMKLTETKKKIPIFLEEREIFGKVILSSSSSSSLFSVELSTPFRPQT